MNQLPIFVTLRGRNVMLVGDGDAADAKRRLIERAGGVCVSESSASVMLAFVAVEDPIEAADTASRLKTRGLLVNVVDQPDYCDFTTPAIIDRDPVLIAVGTGGASAGLAKALRQRLELLLPEALGPLASAMAAARDAIRSKWPDNKTRRKAIDAALSEAGLLDPMADCDASAVGLWLQQGDAGRRDALVIVQLTSLDPDDLTIRQARVLGQADHIYHPDLVRDSILSRARADAIRHVGSPPVPPPPGLVIHIRLPDSPEPPMVAA